MIISYNKFKSYFRFKYLELDQNLNILKKM